MTVFNALKAEQLIDMVNSGQINRNTIVSTIFRLIWNQTEFRLVLN